eukprot:scaffold100556_cov63-Phaeocystis_antarctica.AAC.1
MASRCQRCRSSQSPCLSWRRTRRASRRQSNDVQRVIQSLMDRPWPTWYPKVCISYAIGTRNGTDAQGAGPGMLQAAAITHALYNAGIACASGLCVPASNDRKDFLPKIDSRPSRCKVLIVLLSPAFYHSHPCLLEVHKATKARRMDIIPLRCAEPLPREDDQWPDMVAADSASLTVLDQVQDKLGALNALPPRGCFFDSPTRSEAHTASAQPQHSLYDYL